MGIGHRRIGAGLGRGVRGGGGAAWTPLSSPTLVAWWDPRTFTVASWVDRRGLRTVAQGTGANQPALIASDPNFAGRPSVDHQGGTKYMSGTGFASVAQPYSVIVVMHFHDTTGTEAVIDDAGGSNTVAPLFQHNATTPQWQIVNNTLLTQNSARTTDSTAFLLVFNGANSAIYTANDWTTPVVTGNAGSGTFEQLRIGASGAAGNPLNGSIAALVFDTAPNLATYRSWVASFGITVT